MITASFYPYCSPQPFLRPQDVVACIGTAAVCLPRRGVLAGWDDGLRSAQRAGFMAVPRVVSAIATDAGKALVGRNLAEQRWQGRCVAETVVSDFHSLDFERGCVDPKMHLAPLAAVIGAVLLRLPFTFALHFNARAVH